MAAHVEVVKRFFHLLEQFSTDSNEYKSILHPMVERLEYPNLMMGDMRKRTYDNLIAGAEAGRKMLSYQRFEFASFIEAGDKVIAEFQWSGELKTRAGKLKPGLVLKAYICAIFEFRDDKIYRQRNYDCYEHF